MAEENIEGLEPENTPNEEESIETPEEEPTSEKTPTEAEPSLTKEQKSKLDSFDRIYAENKKLKGQLKSRIGKSEDVEVWEAPNDPLEVVKLGKALKDYSEDETEFILRNAPNKNLEGILKAEKDPMVQAAIQATREKVARENKTPVPSGPSSATESFDAEKSVKEGKELEEIKKRYEAEEKEGQKAGV